MIKVDCHGLSHKNAKYLVEDKLLQASQNGSFVMEIITGNSQAMQSIIIDQVLTEWDFDYYIPSNNLGKIIVNYTYF